MRTRVLFLSSCIHGGGAGQSLYAYLSKKHSSIDAHIVLPERGVMYEKFASVATVHLIPEFVERIQKSPYAWVQRANLPWLHWLSNFVAIPIAAEKISRLCNEIRPDVLYANHMLANPVGAYVAKRTNLPLIFHQRNIHVAPFGKAFYKFLARQSQVKAILCNSFASSLLFRDGTPEKVRVIYNFLGPLTKTAEVQPLARKTLGLAPGDFLVGYVGRLLAKKGIPTLISAIARLKQKGHPVHLVLLGAKDGGVHHDIVGQYKELANGLGMGSHIHFLGFQKDIAPYVADFDVLALPSIEPESFGRVLIEAMSLGIPCVTTAHGGAVEVVTHGYDGLWAKVGDANDMAEQIEKLLNNSSFKSKLSRNGALTVHQSFNEDLCAKALDLVIQAVAHGQTILPQKSLCPWIEDKTPLALDFQNTPKAALVDYRRKLENAPLLPGSEELVSN